MRRTTQHKIVIVIESVIILVLLFLAITAVRGYIEYTRPTTVGTEVELVIEQGTGTREVAQLLKKQKIIQYPLAFLLKVIESDSSGKIHYGTYTVNTGMSLDDLVAVLTTVEPSVVRETVTYTIPEGYSIEMIGDKLEEVGLCNAEDFYEVANQKELFEEFEFLDSIPNDTKIKYQLQGFLFPDTYEVYADVTAEDLVRIMLTNFDKKFDAASIAQAKKMKYSIFDIVIMASIVEREAKLDEERATIAGVINNRLDVNMKLQMCPTVLYAITDGYYNVGQVLYSDLEAESLYNTYRYEGLPIGPICNPGQKSMQAVLYPESHNYFYYHTDSEEKGNHIFSETYQEHQDSRILQND